MTQPTNETGLRTIQAEFHIDPPDRPALVEVSGTGEEPGSLRANILLASDEGLSGPAIAQKFGVTRWRVYYWRRRYRLAGLQAVITDSHTGTEAVQGKAPNPGKKKGRGNKRKRRQEALAASALSPEAAGTPAQNDSGPALVAQRPEIGLLPGDTLAEAGRKIFAFFFANMLSHEPGTRLGEDIEELHDMRVATRRMRAAFDIFGAAFRPHHVKVHLKGLRTTGRALGAVRDWDVFLVKAARDIHLLGEIEQENLSSLLDYWRSERESARQSMFAYLDSEPYREFVDSFSAFVQTPGKHEETIQDGTFDGEPVPSVRAIAHLAPVLIYKRLGAVRAFAGIIPHAKIVQLHALRIQFKSLHYILDFHKEILGTQAKSVLADVKRMQDHLGDLNDADVACQRLGALLENWERNQLSTPLAERQTPASLLAYLSLKHRQRHDLLVSFPAAWEAFDTLALRQQLAASLAIL